MRAFEPQRQPHVVTNCSENNGGCSHLCLLSPEPAGYRCACPTGVKLVDQYNCANGKDTWTATPRYPAADGHWSRDFYIFIGPQELLVVVQRMGISKISLDCPDYTLLKLPLQSVEDAITVDYDPVDDFIYWSDEGVSVVIIDPLKDDFDWKLYLFCRTRESDEPDSPGVKLSKRT